MGLQGNQIYGFYFIFMFKAFLSALFRFFSCIHNFTITTAQTASIKQRHKIPGQFSSFSLAHRITKFLSTLTLHSPTQNQGARIFLSIALENIPSWCASHGLMHEQEEPLPTYTQQQRKTMHTLRRTAILLLLFPPLKRNKKKNDAAYSRSVCWPDILFCTWQDLKRLPCKTSLCLT